MTTTDNRTRLRAMVRGAYDLQKLRIQAGLRLCANFRSQIGQAAGDVEEDLDDEAKEILEKLRESFKRLTDGIADGRKGEVSERKKTRTKGDDQDAAAAVKKVKRLPRRDKFKGDDLISDYTDLVLVSQYFDLESVERAAFLQLAGVLEEFELYVKFLKPIRGIGPAMAGVILSEFDIHRARYVSSLWKYAGLDVGPDGRGRSRRKEHLVQRDYINADGEPAQRASITYNPFLKTKLMGVLAGSFLRSASPYADIYRSYKHRLETDPAKVEWTKGRRNEAAKRYMVKMFLAHLYNFWRPLEGLVVEPPYSEAKLGMRPHGERDAAE